MRPWPVPSPVVNRLVGAHDVADAGPTQMERPAISPMPPLASGVRMPWDARVDDPVAVLAEARASLGDTFVVDSGEDRYLFVFSPSGVAAFYALPEAVASKGVADWRMLRRKLPDEMFVGRRTLPGQLFGRDDVAAYVGNVTRALGTTVAELGDEGEVDAFVLSRRLGHRIGLASWGGPGSDGGERFDRLVAALDALDGADSFVHPDAMAAVASSGKSAEYEALDDITDALGAALDDLPGVEMEHPLFARVAARWSGDPARGGSDRPCPGSRTHTHRFHVQSLCRPGLGPHRSPGASQRGGACTGRGTGSGPNPAHSNPPASHSGRSWPATC